MTNNCVEKIISIAEAEVGYLEKASPNNLDSKSSNAGKANYTKYARDLKEWVGSPFTNGVAWCVIFVVWCFVKAFGVEEAKKLLYVWTMSCGSLKDAFVKNKLYFKDAQVGDVVIFQWKNSKGELCRHTGIVYKTDSKYIYTIEGNTSAASNTVIPNGGGVFKKSYLKTNSKIDGYCRPKYPESIKIAKPTLNKRLKEQGKIDKSQVKILQQNLNSLRFKGKDGKKLAVDGSFGANTEYAVKSFQKKYGLEVDGSYGPKSYAVMLEVLD